MGRTLGRRKPLDECRTYRFVLSLSDDECAALRERSAREVVSMAAVARRAIRKELGLPEETNDA